MGKLAAVRCPHRVIGRQDRKFCGSQVRISACFDWIFRFLPIADLIVLLVFFDDQEGDVVTLRHALRKFLNGMQELLLERMTSRGGLLLNDFEQSFLSEHLIPLVTRFRKAIGINHQNISLVEMERAGLVRDGSESSQDQIAGGQQLDLSRVGTEQIGWIMSSADELPHALRVQEEKKERDEPAEKSSFVKELVNPVQDFLRLSPGAKFGAESAQQHRT
jgi:hypothetical protein